MLSDAQLSQEGRVDVLQRRKTVTARWPVGIKKGSPLWGAAIRMLSPEDQDFLQRLIAAMPPRPANSIKPAAGRGTVATGDADQ